MSEDTARLGLPLIEAGQAQKEVTHNEALAALDLLVQASVVAAGVDDPPSAPSPGEAWVVGAAPTGDWAGQAQVIAGWTAGGWRFSAPAEGRAVWCAATGRTLRFHDGAWEEGVLRGTTLVLDGTPVVGVQRAAITDPAGGTTVDAEARFAIGLMLAALRGHGLIAA